MGHLAYFRVFAIREEERTDILLGRMENFIFLLELLLSPYRKTTTRTRGSGARHE
jgi:hypothetical protein